MSRIGSHGRAHAVFLSIILTLAASLNGCGSSGGGLGGNGGYATPRILDPNLISKFVQPLVIPPVMPYSEKNINYTKYDIGARQFQQQVLPPGFPPTTVWGYGNANEPFPKAANSTFNYPAFTIETRSNETVRINWVNQLMDAQGNYLPHLLAIDQTLHWANPPGPPDFMGMDPNPYTGPVPLVTHVHGAHVPDISDGYPEAWFLPAAHNIPAGYSTRGTHYRSVFPAAPGAAIFEYPNSQSAATLWYHDHALGMTRTNVYAGLAGFWIIRDATEDSLGLPQPAPELNDTPGTNYFEIPIVVQDRVFMDDGTLFYPRSRDYFGDYSGSYFPQSDVPPIWNPEFFGNTMVVNGRTWPYLEVEQNLYRFRLLNGCNARFLILKFNRNGLQFHQVGNEGGLLSHVPKLFDQLVLGPAERADVIVDFSGLAVGDSVILLNLGPDEPYAGTHAQTPQTQADPASTGMVMKFVVKREASRVSGRIPDALPAVPHLSTTLPARNLTLNEEVGSEADVPIAALLGTDADGPMRWMDEITEQPLLDTTEMWNFFNLTMDAHPMHLHLVRFQVVERRSFDAESYMTVQMMWLEGGKAGPMPDVNEYLGDTIYAPEEKEDGWKETVIANPGEVTRIIAHFDMAGLYVWHCHIVEHEDNEMMRPYRVLP
jgi:spore coat protein A, manganese oxidase